VNIFPYKRVAPTLSF